MKRILLAVTLAITLNVHANTTQYQQSAPPIIDPPSDRTNQHMHNYSIDSQQSAFIESYNTTQQAFDHSKPTDATLLISNYNELETYKLRLREYMATVIVLPEPVAMRRVGDAQTFKVAIDSEYPNIVSVQPEMAGADSSLHLFGESGNIYTFYLRSDNYKSDFIPHFKVIVEDPDLPPQRPQKSQNFSTFERGNSETTVAMKSLDGDIQNYALSEIEIDPSKFTFAYSIAGSSSNADGLLPTYVYDDGNFTYFQFSEFNNESELRDLPAIFKVQDESDTPTNATVNGGTVRVEGISNEWTLRLGDKYVCIERIQKIKTNPSNLGAKIE